MKNYFCDTCLDGEVGLIFRLVVFWRRKCPKCNDEWFRHREEFFERMRHVRPSPPPPPPKRIRINH